MKIVPEPDRLDARVPLGILAVSIVTLVLGAVLTVGVRAFSEVRLPASGSAVSPSPSGPRPFAVEVPAAQSSGLFGRHTAAAPTRQLPERLREYGWVDRERGLVRIPIERAKELYLARKAGVTQPVSHQEEGSP
jgi:hypothetical protein